jgi:low temperature requirement protein LtrA
MVLLQMIGAVALTINIHGAFGETSGNFAPSYAAIRAFLVVEYIRAGCNIPAARTLANKYAEGFFISTTICLYPQ